MMMNPKTQKLLRREATNSVQYPRQIIFVDQIQKSGIGLAHKIVWRPPQNAACPQIHVNDAPALIRCNFGLEQGRGDVMRQLYQ